MTDLLRKRPLTSFFVIAYLGSWLLWLPNLLGRGGLGLLPYDLDVQVLSFLNAVGIFVGPYLAAHLVTRALHGPAGVRELRARFVKVKAHWWWYLLALIVVPGVLMTGIALWPGAVPFGPLTAEIAITVAVLWLPYLAFGGPLAEEPGWRGFALPRLQQRMHPALAALVLGLLWFAWHIPQFFTRDWDTARGNPTEVLAYVVLVVALSYVMAWIYNGTGGSLFLCFLAHNSVNVASKLIALLSGSAMSNVPAAAAALALAVLALVVSRGRLAAPPTGVDQGGGASGTSEDLALALVP